MTQEREAHELESVALQNAASILRARQKVEQELLETREELRESHQRLSNILESIPDGFVVIDRDWRITYLNPSALTILAPLKSRSELLWEVLWEAFPDLVGTPIEAHYRRAMGGEFVQFETYYGPIGKWLDIRSFPHEGGISIDFQDITPRKRIEESLRENEELLDATFDQAAVGIAIASLDGRFERVNAKFCEILGYTPDELRGMTFMQITQPEDALTTRENVGKLLAGEIRDFVQEKRYVAKDGNLVWSRTAVSTLKDAQGANRRFIGVIEDITLRRETEEALRQSNEFNRTVIDSSRDCIKTLDLEGTLTWISDSGRRTMRIDEKTGEVVGQSWVGFWQGEDRQSAQAAVEAAARGESGGFVGYFPVAGEARWWDVVVTPIHDAFGRPDELLAVSRDITERVAAEHERKQLLESERAARANAERASQMKDDFLATLSHELRTPLGAILGWAQILQRSGVRTPEELQKGLETIERNARVQTQLIEDLLDMSRITSGKLRLDVQTVEPVAFIEAAVETVRHAVEGKGLRIEKLLDPAAGPVAGDPHRLQQILWNLISNAVKFTPKGGKIQVTLQRVNSHVEITVSDSGSGIDPAFLPHLFERFRQADASMTRSHGGLGLGLSIVKHLTELHGGSIQAHSAGPGQGAAFTLSLPLAIVRHAAFAQDRVHPQSAPNGGVKFGPVDLKGLKVLVVDDEPDGREIVRRVLAECNADVTTAASGREALELIRAQQPDVLISDIGMPEMDGFEFLKRLRAMKPTNGERIPAIALTAFARSEDRTRSLRAGFQVHVSKPVEPTELIATVASVAGR